MKRNLSERRWKAAGLRACGASGGRGTSGGGGGGRGRPGQTVLPKDGAAGHTAGGAAICWVPWCPRGTGPLCSKPCDPHSLLSPRPGFGPSAQPVPTCQRAFLGLLTALLPVLVSPFVKRGECDLPPRGECGFWEVWTGCRGTTAPAGGRSPQSLPQPDVKPRCTLYHTLGPPGPRGAHLPSLCTRTSASHALADCPPVPSPSAWTQHREPTRDRNLRPRRAGHSGEA